MADFCLGVHAATAKTSLEFQKIMDDNFVTQKILHPTQGYPILDLVLIREAKSINEKSSASGVKD